MEMKAGLQLRMLQTQKLVMTPQLQQALKLLQMPSLELQQILKQELMMNPVLEEVEELEETPEERQEADEEREREKEKEKEAEEDREADSGDENREEIDWDEYFHSPQDYSHYRQNEESL